MKILLVIFCLTLASPCICQETPVQWNADISKEYDNTYVPSFRRCHQKDWYVYAGDLDGLGITATVINWNNENIVAKSDLETQSNPIVVADKVFKSKLRIYVGGLALQQHINIRGVVPATLRITISGFSANGKIFLPFEAARDVSIEDGVAGNLRSIDRTGLVYGGFIFAIYLFASLPFHLLGNIDPAIFNKISTSVWTNVFFFLVFVLFSLSLFGLFEIKTPGNLSSKTGVKGSLKTVSGIFFMALTLAIVSVSCTGPILGTLLVGSLSANGGAWELTAV